MSGLEFLRAKDDDVRMMTCDSAIPSPRDKSLLSVKTMEQVLGIV